MLPPVQLTFLVFGSVSMLVYTMIFLVIQRSQDAFLAGSFFRLCSSNYVVDLIFFIQFNALMRFRKYRIAGGLYADQLAKWPLLPRISFGFYYYIRAVACFGEVAVSVNRLTSTTRPLSYEKIWSSTVIWLVRAVQFSLPAILLSPIVLNPKKTFQYVSYGSVMGINVSRDATEELAIVDFVISAVASVASMVMDIISVIRIRTSLRRHDSVVRCASLNKCFKTLFCLWRYNIGHQNKDCTSMT
ncbi:unnamed protein product [Heligmosomoides polygyrus]|uniref:Serpentine receptor class gamma n=1 Tax=Heligmosomoides polygyrus TaxID=6339 RepID=A0A183GBR5_HELPZ|nr:unnamed protein product [Heligmosomoides polygyrus]